MDNKELLNSINQEIDGKVYQKNVIYSIDEDLNSLNKGIDDCINLISNCVKGKKANEIITNLSIENSKVLKQCNNTLQEDKALVNRELEDLNNKQQAILKEIEDENEKNEEDEV